jgi:hypothetical protein
MGTTKISFNVQWERTSPGPDDDQSVIVGETYNLPSYGAIDECAQIPCPECKQPKQVFPSIFKSVVY